MVHSIRKNNKTATPIINSRIIMTMEISRDHGIKTVKKDPKSAANTSKYSCILISVPMGSFSLIKPEKMNNPPTKNLEN
ncbi:MAG: hypothetical protein RL161_1169 [Bacteroidota bacterium]